MQNWKTQISTALLGLMILWQIVTPDQYFINFIFALFLPYLTILAIPFSLLLAWRKQRVFALVWICLSLALFKLSYSPQSPKGEFNKSPLVVLNANLLGMVDVDEAFFTNLTEQNPDIITLQELNPSTANKLRSLLGSSYQCLLLKEAIGVRGMGIIAKGPCQPLTVKLDGLWIEKPLIATVQDIATHREIIVASFHALPPQAGIKDPNSNWPLAPFSNTVRQRELALKEMLNALSEFDQAKIIAGDLNASRFNAVYEIFSKFGYLDSGKNSFELLGGTWPSPVVGALGIIPWWTRIDYVFHSAHFTTQDSFPLGNGFGSDHRPVVSKLSW